MKIRRFFGKDMREALNQVKQELGADAVIMSNKKMADGVEIVAAYDQEPPAKSAPAVQQPITAPQNLPPSASAAPGQMAQAKASSSTVNPSRVSPSKAPTTLSDIIGDAGPDSLRALLDKQAEAADAAEAAKSPQPIGNSFTGSDASVSPEQSSSISDIKEELSALRDVLQYQVAGLLKQQRGMQHPMVSYLIHQLEQMGISEHLAEELSNYAPAESSEREAWLYVMKLLANRTATTNDDILRQGGVVALVGPTGTGKTTTIAKLAAQFALKHGADSVALITTDSYRIAAFEQLATYGKIIGCAVKKAQNSEQLSELLLQFRSKKLVLIDTAGFGQRDTRLIKQLDTLNNASYASIKHYVVLQANAQLNVMERILSAYRQIPLQGCVFTKLDECYSLGEAISVAVEHRLPIAYVTDGQRVPEDIQAATAKQLITTAVKLFKKYNLAKAPKTQVVNSALAV